MLKYILSAIILNFFSINSFTKRVYRHIGNLIGGPLRVKNRYIRSHVRRSELFREFAEKNKMGQSKNKMLEIGTGWVHWHSLYHKIFYDDEIYMLDIWDCRHLIDTKVLFATLRNEFKRKKLALNKESQKRLDLICDAKDFDTIYEKLNLSYIIEEQGSIEQFQDNIFDSIFSFHVLEHVPKENTEGLIENMYRSLKPGGYSIHQIGIDDHLTHFDSSQSPKKYISYSDNVWKLLFENQVQYFNRIQMSEWLNLFDKKGFKTVLVEPDYCNIENLMISSRFSNYSNEDLKCTTLTIIHQKPR